MSYQVTSFPIVPELSLSSPAYRLKISVASETLDPAVFVYQKAEANDLRGDGWFTCVANAAQLAEYPDKEAYEEGDGATQVPYYRDSELDLIGRHPQDLQDLYQEILLRIGMLKKDLGVLDSQMEGETTTVI